MLIYVLCVLFILKFYLQFEGQFLYDYFYKNLNFVPQFLFLFGAHFNSLIFSMLFYCFHQHECIVGVSMYRYFAATCNQVGIASTNGISVGAALVQWGESVNQ